LIDIRQHELSLMTGVYTPVFTDQQVIAFTRHAPDADQFLIVLNLTHRPCYFNPAHFTIKGKVEISTSSEWDGKEINSGINLGGDEGIIVRLIN
jgi:alpha-glucosidase